MKEMDDSGEGNTKIVDPTAGGLVWVRRRNGAWWPGRILSADELPETSNASPKTGTPVKLLGRKDANVDWYNLEKSKRVKAFRCGDHDDCIEKAKASVSNSCRKASKYARRYDAILHALEIESAFCSTTAKRGVEHEDSISSEEIDLISGDPTSSFEEDSIPAQELSQSGVSFEDLSHITVSKDQSAEGRRRRTPNDSEDEGIEGCKRMKGLEDLGIVSMSSSLKKKRSQAAYPHEFLKRKNRRRQLRKVLESSTMVTVPIVYEQLLRPAGSSLLGVCNSRISSIWEKENAMDGMRELPEGNSAGTLYDVPLVEKELHLSGFSLPFLSSASQKPSIGTAAQSSPSSQIETVSLENEEIHESGSTSSGAAPINNFSRRIREGTSRGQLRGKRDTRSETQQSKCLGDFDFMEKDDEPNPMVPTADLSPQKSLPHRNARYTVNPKYQSADFFVENYNLGSFLYDVNLEVKASYRPQHVPYVSLVSKLNGQPITGHPLSVETLEDGFSHILMNNSAEHYSSSCDLDDNLRGKWLLFDMDVGPKPKPVGSSKISKTRRDGLSSKKIRRLSSLTGLKRPSKEEKRLNAEKHKKGLSVACVPLKVVFSRINAALSGPISLRGLCNATPALSNS